MKNTTEYTLEELAHMVIASNQKMLEFSEKNHQWKFELTPAGAKVIVTRRAASEPSGELRPWVWVKATLRRLKLIERMEPAGDCLRKEG